MEDFASSAMMRLVQSGLARQGLDAPLARPGGGAHVPLVSKRDGVERILAEHGPLALLRIGEALRDLPDAPVLAAMEQASSPAGAIDRWRRLETYVHSRHRTEIVRADAGGATLRHFSRVADDPPRRAEDLLVFGVIVALLGWVGATDLRARPVGDERWIFAGEWLSAPVVEDCATWRIEWGAVEASGSGLVGGEGEASLSNLIRGDLMRRWTIADAAKALGKSKRTLQRELGEGGESFTQTIADARAAAAVRLLDRSEMSLGEIGFVCGYADQAHFTRSFKAAMATTPRAYREGA